MANFPLLKKCIARGVRNALSEIDKSELEDTELIIDEIIDAILFEINETYE
jgi:hypothetical protein